jgi:hypothetical protein
LNSSKQNGRLVYGEVEFYDESADDSSDEVKRTKELFFDKREHAN